MDNNKEVLYYLMENYFYDCKNNGYSDFAVWCEDNVYNEEQENLVKELKQNVEAVAWLLFSK